MEEIRFELNSFNGVVLELDVHSRGETERLIFEFDEPVPLSDDTLAVALSTLCGTAFDSISFGFPVSSKIQEQTSAWAQSSVTADETAEVGSRITKEARAVLNFSGGLDSLASKYLLGGEPTLVSLDFGGRFARELDFFKQFEPAIVHTNLADTSLRHNSWAFMGIGPLLLADTIEDEFFAFGSILEAGQLRVKEPRTVPYTFPPFRIAGYTSVAPVAGISEVGTVLVVARHEPSLLSDSLRSLANPGEEKFYRKIALAYTVADIVGEELELPPLPDWQRVHYKFGQNFAVDLTALFFKAYGRDEFAEAIVSGTPSLWPELTREDFNFMLKADQNYYASYPESLRAELESALKRSGIEWYSEAEYESVEKVRRFLSGHYQF